MILKEAQEKYPVVLNLFDVLLIEKEPMINKRYDKRRSALEDCSEERRPNTT